MHASHYLMILPLYPEHVALGFSELIATSVYSCSSAAPRTIGEEQDKSSSSSSSDGRTSGAMAVKCLPI